MTNKTILILPNGKLQINNNTVQYDDKYDYILDNLKNPWIPDCKVIMDNQQIGRVINYAVMEDGLYCDIEFANDINLLGKYPIPTLSTYTDNNGVDYQYNLESINLVNEKQYSNQEMKELNKEMQMDERLDPVNFNTFEEFIISAIPVFVEQGISEDEAMEQCKSRWAVKGAAATLPNEPVKKSKLEIMIAVKKLFERSGLQTTDEKILEIFKMLDGSNGTLSKLNKKLDSSKNTHDIQVFPKKTVYIEKYDERVNFDDKLFDEMILGFKCDKLFKPYIDENHELGIKYANIIDLYKNETGLFAKIELNERGKLAIKNNDYSYISPEWGDRTDTDGVLHKNVLWAITLTNIPALEGENPRLQDQIKLTKRNISNGGNNMSMTLSQRLANLEGKVSTYKLQDGQAPIMPPEIIDAIQMIKDALLKIDELTMQNQEVIEEKQAALKKIEVAEKTALETQEKLKAIELEKNNAEKEAFFELAVKENRVEPSEVDMWKEQYDKSPDFVTKYLSSKEKQENQRQSTTNTLSTNSDDIFIYNGKKYKFDTFAYKNMKLNKFDRTKTEDKERYIDEVGIEEVK